MVGRVLRSGGGVLTANHLLYQSYENWCEANGATPKKQRQFGRAVSHKGFLVGQKQRMLGDEFRGVVGLKIIESLAN
jgi:phage/plasmid-associated DNA primase